MHRLQLKILDDRLGNDFPLPDYATDGSAGLDMRACIDAPLTVNPGDTELVPTGLAIHVADPGLAAVLLVGAPLGGWALYAQMGAPGLPDQPSQ